MSKNIKIEMNENKNINELKEMMRKEYAKNMASLMEYCTEQQQEEEKIGEEILLKEESMSQLLETYEFLQKAEKKLMKDIKKATPEYKEILDRAKEYGITKYIPNEDLMKSLEKASLLLKTKDEITNKVINEYEKTAETNVNNIIDISYDISSELNQLRYKLRKTPEDRQRINELMRHLETVRNKIDDLIEENRDNQ